MKVVAKISYKNLSALDVAELERLANDGFSFHIFCDSATEQVVIVV
jgi:hypothetical protein